MALLEPAAGNHEGSTAPPDEPEQGDAVTKREVFRSPHYVDERSRRGSAVVG